MSRIAVIIPVHNRWEMTSQCLHSLAEHTELTELSVLVVDNGSSDATASACPELGKTLFGAAFTFVRFEHNHNFGPACNEGARRTEAELLFFLNNDTILSPHWLPPLVDALSSDPQLVAVGPLLVYPNKTVQHLGVVISPGGECVSHLYRNILADHPLAQRRRPFQVLTGAALMVARQQFWEVGGFFEGYINGFEDVDLGMRLTSDGKVMSCIPESRIVHLESQTPGRMIHEQHNSQILQQRCRPGQHADLLRLVEADGYSLRIAPSLMAEICLPAPYAKALLQELGGEFDPTRCYDLMCREPLWRQGHLLLSSFLEQHSLPDEAIRIYYQWLSMTLCPDLPVINMLTRVLQQQHRPTDELEELCTNVRRRICRPDFDALLHYHLAALSDEDKKLTPLYLQAAQQAERLRAEWASSI